MINKVFKSSNKITFQFEKSNPQADDEIDTIDTRIAIESQNT